MTIVIAELYDALRAAGVPEDKAQAAARTRANRERCFDHIDAELTTCRGEKTLEGEIAMVKWIAGANFAGVLALVLRTFVGS